MRDALARGIAGIVWMLRAPLPRPTNRRMRRLVAPSRKQRERAALERVLRQGRCLMTRRGRARLRVRRMFMRLGISGAQAIGVNVLTSGGSTTDQQTYTTASVSPTANALVTIWAVGTTSDSSAAGLYSATGGGMTTWSNIAASPSDAKRHQILAALQSSPGNGTIDLDFGETMNDVTWAVIEFTNVSTSGTNGSGAILQLEGGRRKDGNIATDTRVYLQSFSDATNNMTVFGFADSISTAVTASGLTQRVDQATSGGARIWIGTATGEVLQPNGSVGSGHDYNAFGLELRAAAAPDKKPITINRLSGDASSTNATNYSGATVTVTANRIALAWVLSTKSGGGDLPTLVRTGTGNDFVNVTSVVQGDYRLSLWRNMFASDKTGSIAIQHSVTQSGCAWLFGEYAGVKTTGANGADAVVQSASNSTASGSSLTVTLAAFSSSNNATVGFFAKDQNLNSVEWPLFTPDSGFAVVSKRGDLAFPTNVGFTTPNAGLVGEWRGSNATSVGATFASSGLLVGIAVELAAASTGQTITVNQVTETDTANAVTSRKMLVLGQSTEADAAQALTRAGTVLAQVIEADAAQAITHTKTHTVAQALETDTAQPLARAKTRAIALVAETDTAFALGRKKLQRVGVAIEVDLAQPLGQPSTPRTKMSEGGSAASSREAGSRAVAREAGSHTG